MPEEYTADEGAADLKDEEISEEQDLEDDRQKQPVPGKLRMVLKFFCKCPFGQVCSKGSHRLGQKGWYTEQRAREAIVNHLTASPFHEITKEEADAEAECAEIESWEIEEWPDEPVHAVPVPKRAPQRPMIQDRRGDLTFKNQQQQGQALSVIKNLRGDLTSKIQQQTQNAYVFVKASIACTTFDIYIFIYIYM